MTRTTIALFALALLVTSCDKEEEPATPAAYTPEYTLWAIPKDTSAIRVYVNSDTVPIFHDRFYPYQNYLATELQDSVLYYPAEVRVQPGDVVRIEADGSHDIQLTTHTVAMMDGDTSEFTVYPQ